MNAHAATPASARIDDPALLTLTQAAAAIRSGRLSSREATLACLARIEIAQPRLNAFISIEAEAALKAADAADAALARGDVKGPLHGVPLAHKDMYYDAGHVVTCGSKVRRDWVAPLTATALQRLKDAGTVRLGALHMVEFAFGPTGHNPHYGPARNAWNPDHVTGGSSSGSGTAVAARLTYAALGSDTGGSIRLPAHFCGISGLKTTVGLISRAGAMPLSQSLDTVGPMARTVEDCALLAGLMAGADPADPTCADRPVPDYLAATAQPLAGRVIGIPTRFYVDDLDADVAEALDEAIVTFARAGARLVPVDLPDQSRLSAASTVILLSEAAAFHAEGLARRPQDYGDQVRARIENGFVLPAVTYLEALRWRGPALAAHLEAIKGLDAVLAPGAPMPAPTLAETDLGGAPNAEAMIQRLTRFTRPVNYLGLPAVSIPAGFTKTGLPVGLQLMGKPFDEATLLALGAAFQRETDFHTKMPELP
ncbi:amidase [Aquabacter cavernae]|uniref:amidase n=1 Tax=Aquabacter cavernae TaxID=2496029 RepID=UPI000F8D32F5|nr:amidase [Aquabacter cavernae]